MLFNILALLEYYIGCLMSISVYIRESFNEITMTGGDVLSCLRYTYFTETVMVLN